MSGPSASTPTHIQYAWRGWILGLLFLVLAWERFVSEQDLAPIWLLLVLLGSGWRLYAGRYIGGHTNSLNMDGAAIAVSGPYLFSRHPLYLANILTSAGLILFANCLPAWGASVLIVMVCAHHVFLALAEERFLTESQGEAYLGYLRVTPRWLGFARQTGGAQGTVAPATAALTKAWRRQGMNLGKTGMAVLILWVLAQLQ